MKIVKDYNDFSDSYRLNENFLKKIWVGVIDYFNRNFGKNSWIYYSIYLEQKGELINKKSNKPMVELIYPSRYLENLKKKMKSFDIEGEMKSKFKDNEKIDKEDENDISDRISRKFASDSFSEKEKESDIQESVKLNEINATLTYPLGDSGEKEIVRNVNVSELKKRIERVYKMNLLRANRHEKEEYSEDSKFVRKKTHAVFIWGAPGIGKTEILHQVADSFDLFVQEWHLSQIEPTDFRGVPKVENIVKGSVDPKDERTVSKLPAIFPTNDGNGNGGIMFFDEMNRAPEMVLSASLALALSGKFGEYELPPRWIVIAAGNRPTDITSVQLTDDPILWNRFGHVNYVPEVDDWVKWAKTVPFINPDLVEFLQFHKQFFHKYDPESKRANWPSPRTWAMASEVEYYDLRDENWDNKISEKALKDHYTEAVGLDAAVDFIAYLKLKSYYSEKDIKDVYEKGAAAKKPPTRLDEARAVALAIAYWKREDKLNLTEMKNVLNYALSLPNVESRTSLASCLKNAHPYIKTDEPFKTEYYKFLKEWHIKLGEIN